LRGCATNDPRYARPISAYPNITSASSRTLPVPGPSPRLSLRPAARALGRASLVPGTEVVHATPIVASADRNANDASVVGSSSCARPCLWHPCRPTPPLARVLRGRAAQGRDRFRQAPVKRPDLRRSEVPFVDRGLFAFSPAPLSRPGQVDEARKARSDLDTGAVAAAVLSRAELTPNPHRCKPRNVS